MIEPELQPMSTKAFNAFFASETRERTVRDEFKDFLRAREKDCEFASCPLDDIEALASIKQPGLVYFQNKFKETPSMFFFEDVTSLEEAFKALMTICPIVARPTVVFYSEAQFGKFNEYGKGPRVVFDLHGLVVDFTFSHSPNNALIQVWMKTASYYIWFEKLQAAFMPLEHTPVKESKIAFLALSQGELYLKETTFPLVAFNPDYYNEGVEEFHKGICAWLAGEEKGIAILHGPPGTGKTFYLRHLCGLYDNIVYVPPGLTNQIGDPAFIEFLSANPNKIFVVEDAESVIVSDGKNRSPALQNLLNASDGLLGDIIKCKFLVTFNVDTKFIDPALTRAGRTKFIREFKELDSERANALAAKLGKVLPCKDIALAEIFSASAVEKKEERRIGFGS